MGKLGEGEAAKRLRGNKTWVIYVFLCRFTVVFDAKVDEMCTNSELSLFFFNMNTSFSLKQKKSELNQARCTICLRKSTLVSALILCIKATFQSESRTYWDFNIRYDLSAKISMLQNAASCWTVGAEAEIAALTPIPDAFSYTVNMVQSQKKKWGLL